MRLLVSACLLGVCCRYDGSRMKQERVIQMMKHHELIPVCPEQLGGLRTPREPAERSGSCVITQSGVDVTEAYEKGAQETLWIANLYQCRYAILKERSPSCGCDGIYDGQFQNTLIEGKGVTAQLLEAHDISVFGESQLDDLAKELSRVDN